MQAMRLSLAAGRLDWRRALNEITPRDFAEWIAFDLLEPVGMWRLASMTASVVANEVRLIASGLGGQKMKPEDLYEVNAFVPLVQIAKQEQERKAQIESLDSIVGL